MWRRRNRARPSAWPLARIHRVLAQSLPAVFIMEVLGKLPVRLNFIKNSTQR